MPRSLLAGGDTKTTCGWFFISEVVMFNPLFAGHEEAIKLLRQFTQTDFGPVIEIGLGQKTFLDHLLNEGCLNLTALDMSEEAVELAKKRYANFSSLIRWVCADVLTAPLKQGYYALWHDGAVFERLVSEEQRQGYIELLESSLRPGGYAVIYATTALEEAISKLHESSLEIVSNNWNPLYALYFGSSDNQSEASNKELRVVKKGKASQV
jgi:SAM-dependent methyltransferase